MQTAVLHPQLAKERMDREFNQNRLLPGDPGYVYDKEVDFQPVSGSNDWDDSSNEDDDDGNDDAGSCGKGMKVTQQMDMPRTA